MVSLCCCFFFFCYSVTFKCADQRKFPWFSYLGNERKLNGFSDLGISMIQTRIKRSIHDDDSIDLFAIIGIDMLLFITLITLDF